MEINQIRDIKSIDDFDSLKHFLLLIVYYYAPSSATHEVMSSEFQRVAEKFSSYLVVFATCDFEKATDVCEENRVYSYPTFVVFYIGERVDCLIGASPKELEELVHKHVKSSVPD